MVIRPLDVFVEELPDPEWLGLRTRLRKLALRSARTAHLFRKALLEEPFQASSSVFRLYALDGRLVGRDS
jgi:hypothetical protein